jgi:hypothetical protein
MSKLGLGSDPVPQIIHPDPAFGKVCVAILYFSQDPKMNKLGWFPIRSSKKCLHKLVLLMAKFGSEPIGYGSSLCAD